MGAGMVEVGPLKALTDAPSACLLAFEAPKGWLITFVRPYANRGERLKPEPVRLFSLISPGEGPPRPVPEMTCTLQVAIEGLFTLTFQTPSGVVEAFPERGGGLTVNFDIGPLGLKIEGEGALEAERLDSPGRAKGEGGEIRLESPGIWKIEPTGTR